VLLEHLLLREIRAYQDYAGVKGSLGYWATPSGTEVDFVWWRGRKVVAIGGSTAGRCCGDRVGGASAGRQ
jgi:hypothetical protein